MRRAATNSARARWGSNEPGSGRTTTRSGRILGKRAFGQNLQVLLVVFSGFGFISEFFLAHGETEAGNGVVVFVVESVLVALERAAIVLAPEVIIADLNVFHRLHRVPGMELLDAGGVGAVADLEIRDGRLRSEEHT